MNLDEMIDLAEQQARTVLLGMREELAPQWLLVKGDGNIEIIATPWHGDEQKYLAVAAMRDVMEKRQVVAYSVLVEAWFAVLSKDEASRPYQRPSERADRRESVVAMAANHWGQSKYRQWEIIRDRRGRCRELQRLDGPEELIMSSLFDNLLVTRRPN